MRKLLLVLFQFLFLFEFASGQKDLKKISNEVRFKTDTINRIYIPKDLEDCFKQIDGFWADSIRQKVKKMPEREFSSQAHLGFGMWMRNNWQLWGGSRLSKYFNDLGISHPDEMSGIILESYHRYLNDSEIKIEEQIQYYQDYMKKSKERELERIINEFSEYKVGDTVLYNYDKGFSSPKQEEKYDKDDCIASGIVLDKNEEKHQLNIRLIKSCDRKGIIYFDSDRLLVYNKQTDSWEKPNKRELKYMKVGMEIWFDYSDWDTK